jgi:NAD-dependent SIR2 family protein deacetylase
MDRNTWQNKDNRDRQIKAVIAKIREDHPCFGYFACMHCMNKGYLKSERDAIGILRIKKCPFEKSCKKETLRYAKNSDVYNSGQIDINRNRIRELEG